METPDAKDMFKIIETQEVVAQTRVVRQYQCSFEGCAFMHTWPVNVRQHYVEAHISSPVLRDDEIIVHYVKDKETFDILRGHYDAVDTKWEGPGAYYVYDDPTSDSYHSSVSFLPVSNRITFLKEEMAELRGQIDKLEALASPGPVV